MNGYKYDVEYMSYKLYEVLLTNSATQTSILDIPLFPNPALTQKGILLISICNKISTYFESNERSIHVDKLKRKSNTEVLINSDFDKKRHLPLPVRILEM